MSVAKECMRHSWSPLLTLRCVQDLQSLLRFDFLNLIYPVAYFEKKTYLNPILAAIFPHLVWTSTLITSLAPRVPRAGTATNTVADSCKSS